MPEPRRDGDIALTIIAHNRPGVLAKIAGLFYRRGLNIDTLTVRPTGEPERARIVVRVAAGRAEIARVAVAIGNLVDVLAVELRADTAPDGGDSI